MIQQKEVQALRTLAGRWMEHAANPVMAQRRRQWKAVKDLASEKPMILVETCALSDYIGRDELVCADPFARNVERSLYEVVRHADEIGDDIVVDPWFRVPWVLEISDYGVPAQKRGAAVSGTPRSPAQLENAGRLHQRSRCVNRMESLHNKELLEDIFGDILPVRLGGWDPFHRDPGYRPWLGSLYAGLSTDLLDLIGSDNLGAWAHDNPALLQRIMAVICGDWKAHFRFMEKEGLLYANTDTWMPCPGSYGFVSDLPAPSADGTPATLRDCWCWTDVPESALIPSGIFRDFLLPSLAEVMKPFGLAWCGFRHAHHEDGILKAVPNLRAVSVSAESNQDAGGELLGKGYVYSRNPVPTPISGANPDWELLKKDVRGTLDAARGCSLEFCFRGIASINGDRSRLARWVRMTRAMMGE